MFRFIFFLKFISIHYESSLKLKAKDFLIDYYKKVVFNQ